MSTSPVIESPASRLETLESVIEQGKQTFIDVGRALLEIRDSRLYRENYKTFEDYCREKWGWSRPRAYQLIDAASLSTIVDIQNEAQAREFTPLRDQPELMSEVWQEVSSNGAPTAERIREAVSRRMDVHYSSSTDEWSTPQDLFDQLNKEFGFTLDVCASPNNAKCKRFFSRETDGLAQRWTGTCWMNPPYGDAIGEWMEKAHEAKTTVVCLVPARTDTAWWWDYARHGEVRFLRGRLKFGGAESSAPFPSAVVIFGKRACVKWWER